MMVDEKRSFEIEFLQAKLTEVQEAIASLSDATTPLDQTGRRRLDDLERRLGSALASYELAGQTRSVSRR
jgi:hypothetical protein